MTLDLPQLQQALKRVAEIVMDLNQRLAEVEVTLASHHRFIRKLVQEKVTTDD